MSASAGRPAGHPRTLLAVLGIAVCGAVLLLWQVAIPGPRARSRPPERADREPRRPPPPPATPAMSLGDAMTALRGSDLARREEAERFLIAHPGLAKGPVSSAIRPGQRGLFQASLRYVLAGIDERGEGRPNVIPDPPREGLVYFFERMDDVVAQELAAVRRTGRAEEVPVTAVYTGGAPLLELLDRHGALLGEVALYADPARKLVRRWRADSSSAVAGLRRDGHLAFVIRGRPSRTTLAMRAAALERR